MQYHPNKLTVLSSKKDDKELFWHFKKSIYISSELNTKAANKSLIQAQ